MFSLLCDGDERYVPNWVANSFPVAKFILLLIILVMSLVLIVLVLMQESEGEGNTINAITGIKDTYYSKNKGISKKERLKKATIALSSLIAVFVIIFFILTAVYSGSIWS